MRCKTQTRCGVPVPDASTFPAAASCVHSFADLLGGEPQHHIVANLDTFYGCTEFGLLSIRLFHLHVNTLVLVHGLSLDYFRNQSISDTLESYYNLLKYKLI